MIRRKSKEHLKAQVATFAQERVRSDIDRWHIIEHAGEIAVGGLKDRTWDNEYSRLKRGENGMYGQIETVSEQRTIPVDDYMNFMKSRSPLEHELINGREELFDAYEPFAPIVDKLRSEIANHDDRNRHPDHLGSGTFSSVYFIEKDGKRYAVRIPDLEDEDKPNTIDQHMNRAILGRGIPHLEQIIAASYESGVTIAEIMPGKELDRMSANDMKQITDEHLTQLFDTMKTMVEHKIALDSRASNVFFNPQEGFGIIDYHPQVVQGNPRNAQSVGFTVGLMSGVFTSYGKLGDKPPSRWTEDDDASFLELKKAQLDVLNRYRSMAADILTGEDKTKAFEEIDMHIKNVNKHIAKYSSHAAV